ncbi:transporter substrate-binding domain-containing protein [Aliiglaciecola sp. CAU 1673]|uniref:substrate-binding periplasmic protein n=1 Tax=Aliiglaciecola sp. CAU 1673 TaxID=3032595 RepID=UPI0023DC7AB6|nr:transporter substrate-binding domain-containing protein [Aliiglaciecola sp. CAU 1673]MDF2178119.1 transporter substrate-binding domain-containing protein [Aliiglaciecola sp. CAU 1673]
MCAIMLYRLTLLFLLLLPAASGQTLSPVIIDVFDDHERHCQSSMAYGLSWELVVEAAKLSGIPLKAEEVSWDGAMTRLHNGKSKLVFGALWSEERAQWAAFSVPLAPESSSLFTLPSNPVLRIEEIDLNSAVVGVSEGSVQQEYAKKLGFKHIYGTTNRSMLFGMLESGRIHYMINGDQFVNYFCMFQMSNTTVNCLRPVGQPIYSTFVHVIGLKKDLEANLLLKRLNEGLAVTARQPGTPQKFKQHGFSQQQFLAWQEQFTVDQGDSQP